MKVISPERTYELPDAAIAYFELHAIDLELQSDGTWTGNDADAREWVNLYSEQTAADAALDTLPIHEREIVARRVYRCCDEVQDVPRTIFKTILEVISER